MDPGHRTAAPSVHRIELRSEDSAVVVQAKWSQSEDVTSAAKFGRNFLDFAIQSISLSQPTDLKHESFAFGSTILTSDASSQTSEQVKIDTPSKALSLLWETVTRSLEVGPMRFILPAEDGYIVRGDFVEEMFRGCPLALRAKGFTTPGQHCIVNRQTDTTEGSAQSLLALLQSSVGVIVVNSKATTEALDDAFKNRLSWPWTVPVPFKQSRIVIVGEARREMMAQIFYATTRGCGVSVVVMDRPGHWMEDPAGTSAHLREHFVPFTGYTLEDLPQRVVETIRELPYRVDGLLSTVEAFLPGVARAAEILGLPTISPEVYSRATNKYETRRLSPAPTTIKVNSLEDFIQDLKGMSEPLQYPLVVKPTHGHGSLGASKVRNDDELVDALRFSFASLEKQQDLLKLKIGEARVIIETYCEGPEVDVNLALWEDELLFSEVSDNFPCRADRPDADKTDHLGQMGSAYPSGLPQAEIDMLKKDVLAIIRKLGIRSGVVHAEARVHNSTVEWHTDQDGVQELRPRTGPIPPGGAKTFLLEVNPRPPGNPELAASSYVNGMSFYALQLMQITGDEARFRSLSHGFLNRPLYHYSWTPLLLFGPVTGGRMPRDLGLAKYGLDTHHAFQWLLWPGGDIVPPTEQIPHPGLGFMLFRSRESRRDVLEKVAIARHKMHIQLE
ncbi:hypothetical protein BKA67DRAFT_651927 [Truncatella angustata]|uniref:ATP-grasp domain-containing protein n=1 Tax=Truncatella angustata TaxID=152316 RepID=A0A9P8U7X0_9PEZI|nr:uncharacterized protein BKA67DRAFT_651927 [Truncatella angustata]KAH6640024.1 hypothetical protein BKA67DRAFT_651927 [Truncatella angustata]